MKSRLLRLLRIVPVLAFAAVASRAADVPVAVRLSFERGSAQGREAASAAVPAGDAWIFVLDHSGSMDRRDATIDPELSPSAAGKQLKRWDALLVALKATLEQIEPGSVVQIVKVGGRSAELSKFSTGMFSSTNAIVVRDAKDRELLFDTVKAWRSPDGLTPLYHGLFLACQEAQRFIRTENRNACVVVFSDGRDESNGRYTQRNVDEFRSLFDEGGFNACLNWVSQSSSGLPPPPFGPKFVWAQPSKERNVFSVLCGVRPRATFVSRPNPLAAGGRAELSAPYAFSLSPSRWDDLLAEGFDATVGLRTSDGTDVGGDVVHVGKGATSADVVIQIPDSFFSGGQGAMFDLDLDLPSGTKTCRFLQPAPVRLSFEKQGAVTLSSVKPDSGIVAKVGEAVSFSASGTEGASFAWTFGDGAAAQGAHATHAFSAPAPKGVSFSVTASKPGLSPATQSGTVVVVEAGVKLDPLPAGLKVGGTAVFSCRGQGEVASYDWFVDGEPAIGEDAKDRSSSRLSVPLAKVGDHTVRVRANMRRVSPEETPDVAFSVAPAPFAAIVRPEPNERFAAEAVVPLEASVEGGFASGVWTVRDAAGAEVGAPIPSSVVGSAANANFPAPEAGGDFTVSFVAGEGAAAKAAGPVPFSVKAKDVRLDVVSPVKDAPVRTGSAFDLRAATAGLSGSVEFFLVDEASGAETRIADAKIAADGSAAASHVFPVKDGRGERTLVAKAADGKVASDPVPFVLETDAGLVLKAPANNAQVEYGGALVFEAEPSGVVQAKDVQWFLRPAGGAEERIKGGTGARYEHSFAAVPNRKALSYEVYARAPLPDGSSLETDHAAIRAVCPNLNPILTIERESSDDGADDPFSRGRPIRMSIAYETPGAAARAKGVVWDFGDGSSETNLDAVAHSFVEYGERTVTVSAVCSACGKAETAKKTIRIDRKPPKAAFKLTRADSSARPAGDRLGVPRGRTIALVSTSTGDVAGLRWTCDGEPIPDSADKEKVEFDCESVGKRTFALVVLDPAGVPSEPESCSIRVYRRLLFAILLFLAAIASAVSCWYFSGDDPRFWSLLVRIDEERDTSFADLAKKKNRPPKISLKDHWKTASNVATIKMSELTRNSRDAGAWKKQGLGDGEITISSLPKSGKSVPSVRKLNGSFDVSLEDKTEGVFRIVSDSPDDLPVVVEVKQAIGDKTHVLYMVLVSLASFLIAAGLSVWLVF